MPPPLPSFRKILASVKIFVRNSRAGNGCANFMGAWKKCALSAGRTHVHKIPLFRGGGFWVLGRVECRFYFYGRGDFSESFLWLFLLFFFLFFLCFFWFLFYSSSYSYYSSSFSYWRSLDFLLWILHVTDYPEPPPMLRRASKVLICTWVRFQVPPPVYPPSRSAPKSQIAIPAIFLRRGQIARKFPRKSAIFARNSQNEIATLSFLSLVFFWIPRLILSKEFPWLFVRFSGFSKVLLGSAGDKNPWLVWGFSLIKQKKQGKEGQGMASDGNPHL